MCAYMSMNVHTPVYMQRPEDDARHPVHKSPPYSFDTKLLDESGARLAAM